MNRRMNWWTNLIYLFHHRLLEVYFVMEVLDALSLKEVVDLDRLLLEGSSVVECMMKIECCIALLY